MTQSPHPVAVTREARLRLSYHEQMLDAQALCVPCKLCGGKAEISDAGVGCGYYIECGNSQPFRSHKGCLIDQRRVGGWAYNAADWWNRLHAAEHSPAAEERVDAAANALVQQERAEYGLPACAFEALLPRDQTKYRDRARAALRAALSQEHPHVQG